MQLSAFCARMDRMVMNAAKSCGKSKTMPKMLKRRLWLRTEDCYITQTDPQVNCKQIYHLLIEKLQETPHSD